MNGNKYTQEEVKALKKSLYATILIIAVVLIGVYVIGTM